MAKVVKHWIAKQVIEPLKSGKLRWIALENPATRVLEILDEVRSVFSNAQWLIAEQLETFENISEFAQNGADIIVVDATHLTERSNLLPFLKAWMSAVPERPFLFLTNPHFRKLSLPPYLGVGAFVSSTEYGGAEADDRALLEHSRLLVPKYSLGDLILSQKTSLKVTEAIDYIRYKSFCEEEWGFRKRHSRGHGVTLVFHGPSGTGKTMAAEVVAHTLGLPLYQIDLSSILSKWIGETEKNLKAIFRAAEGVGGILLFDEGDAIFGARTEVKDSADKYANLEVNYLLQELEAFDGVVILSTNHERNMDEAFLRRFTYAINFGHPSKEQRKKIWKVNIPAELPLLSDVDFDYLSEFALTGGNIRNIIRDAAALAASAKRAAVSLYDFMWAMKRELQKKGLVLSREALGERMWRLVGNEWEDEPLAKRESMAKSFS